MKLFLITFVKSIDQMIFLEEHLWGTTSAITTNICLTRDWNKNIIGASITASIWEKIEKYKIEKPSKMFLISLQILLCEL